MGNDLAAAIQSVLPPECEVMTGTVTLVNANLLTVLVRGTSIQAAYVGSTAPALGTLVAVLRMDSTWLVLGPLGGVGPQQVLNPSFEADGETASTPSSWFVANLAGSGAARATDTGYAVDGSFELAVMAGAATQDTYVYSSPIAVAPGQVWSVSGFASATYPPATAFLADAALYGLWFANSTNLYPTTSAADTLIAQVNDLQPQPTHVSVAGTVTVPAATSFMRVATRSMSVAGVVMFWDAVFARRVS
jgi:hypothetical protein